jgi:TRAP-type C4-dicarboxylate transport system substrate-binding protein
LEWYAKAVEKETNGRVKIEVHAAGALAGARDTLDMVSKGIIDMGMVVPSFVPAQLPLASGTDLSYIAPSPDVITKALSELYRTYAPFRKEWEVKNNVKVLWHGTTSVAVAGFKKSVTKLEDIQGLKLRGFGHFLKMAKMLGATPVTLAAGEVYEAVSRGIVDGFLATPYEYVVPAKYYEVTPYIVDWGSNWYASNGTVISMDVWKKLPPDIQKKIEGLEPEAYEVILKTIMEANTKYTKVMKAAGVQFYRLPSQEEARWRELIVPMLWDEWVAQRQKAGHPAAEFLEKFKAAAKKHTPGSKWVHPFPSK